MTTIHRILYATDLSSTSEPAWNEARRLGRLFNAEILLLHVVAPPVVLPIEGYFPADLYEEVLRNTRRDAEKELDRLLGSVVGSGLKVRLRLEAGPVATRILEVASQEATDLLVLGTHSRTGLQRAMLGSIADRMVRQATCPVLTVRPRPEAAPRGKIRRICYATDFSPAARAAWRWAVAIASAAGAEVDLVHVTFAPVADRHMPAEAIGRLAQLLGSRARSKSNGSSNGRRCRVSGSMCISPPGFRESRSATGPRSRPPTSSSWVPTAGRGSSAGCSARSRTT